MIRIVRTHAENLDFVRLVGLLDEELAKRDGDEHPFYAQYNTIDTIRHVVLAYSNGGVVGCGAIKPYAPGVMEVKRMFVHPDSRRKGIAALVLRELEEWARELQADRCILETGKKQPEAIGLYTSHGYALIPNYGQYAGMRNSVCFQKDLR